MFAGFHVLRATTGVNRAETEFLFEDSGRRHELNAIDAKRDFEVKARLFDVDDATEAFHYRFFFGLHRVKATEASEADDHDDRD